MSKQLYVDPNVVRQPGKITFQDIPVNQYQKRMKDVRGEFSDEELKNMTVLNERLTLASSLHESKAAELDALGYPAALRDLMVPACVDDQMLRHAVFQRGCYPQEMPVAKYHPDLIGNIVAKWPQWLAFIQENSDVPF